MAFRFDSGLLVEEPEEKEGRFDFSSGIEVKAPEPRTTTRVRDAFARSQKRIDEAEAQGKDFTKPFAAAPELGKAAVEVGSAIIGADEILGGLEEDIGADFKRRQQEIGKAIDDYSRGKQGLLSTGFQLGGQSVGFVATSLFNGFKAGFKGLGNIVSFITPDTIEKPVVEVAKQAPRAIVDALFSKEEQEKVAKEFNAYVDGYKSFKEEHPTFARNIEAAFNYSLLAPTTKAGKFGEFILPAKRTAAELATLEATGPFATKIGELKWVKEAERQGIKVEDAPPATITRLQKQQEKLAGQYRDILNPSKSQIAKTEKAVARGARDPVETIAELQPTLEKIDGNRLGSLNAATEIRLKVIEPAQDAVDALMADVGKQARVNIEEYRARTIADLRRRYDGTQQDAAIKHFNKELDSLVSKRRAQIVEGAGGEKLIQVDSLDEMKTHFWRTSKFDKNLNLNDQVRVGANRSAGHTAKEMIEDAVKELDGGADIGRLNRQLGDYYEAVRFLEQAHGGKLPGGKLGTLFARTIGGIAGTKGGPIGVILGAQSAGKIADILIDPQVSTAYRRWVVNQLKKGTPKQATIANEVEKILKQRGALREARPKLAPPKTIFGKPPKPKEPKFEAPVAPTEAEIEASQKAAGIFKKKEPPLALPAAGQTAIKLPERFPPTQEAVDAATGRRIAGERRAAQETEPVINSKGAVVGKLKEKARFYIADDIPIQRESISIEKIRGTEARGKGTGAHLPESALKEPIIVVKQDDGTYALLDGHHRVKVLKSRGVKEIDAVVGYPELRYSDKTGEPLRKKLIQNAIERGDVQAFLNAGGTFRDLLEMAKGFKFPEKTVKPAKKSLFKKRKSTSEKGTPKLGPGR